MKLYKEPTIMAIASVMAAFAVVGALFVDTDNRRQDATVDTKVPLPLQVGSHKNPSISSSTTTNDANTDAQAGTDSSITPVFQSGKSTSSSSSSNASTNLLGGR